VDGEHLALADTAEELTERCAALLQDRARAERMGRDGAAYVRARFSWDQVAGQFAALCAGAASGRADGAQGILPGAATIGRSARNA
jgi:glycosyltransferase involved in cell wall biosynthesis